MNQRQYARKANCAVFPAARDELESTPLLLGREKARQTLGTKTTQQLLRELLKEAPSRAPVTDRGHIDGAGAWH
jgi:hypothetical protein